MTICKSVFGSVVAVSLLLLASLAMATENTSTGGWAYEEVGAAKYQLVWIKGSGSQGSLATGSPPTYAEGAVAGPSFDLAGNQRVILGNCLAGESYCIGVSQAATTSFIMTSSAVVRNTNIMTNVTTNTSSATVTIPRGSKTFTANVDGTGAQTATVIIYGDVTSTAETFNPLCTITLTATTRDVDACPPVTADYPYYHSVTSGVTGTGAAVDVDVYY